MSRHSRLGIRANFSSSNEQNRTVEYDERVTQRKISYGTKNIGSVSSYAARQVNVARGL